MWDGSYACHEVRPVPSSSAEFVWFHTGSEKQCFTVRSCIKTFFWPQTTKWLNIFNYPLHFLFSNLFTSSTPSIHLGGSFLVTPMAASGSRLIPDTRAIRSSANLKTRTDNSIKTFQRSIQHDDDDQNFTNKIYQEGKRQYLIKFLMWLAESRMVPSKREQWKWEKDRSRTKWARGYQERVSESTLITLR